MLLRQDDLPQNYYGEDGSAHYVNGSLSLALPYHFGLGFEIGYQDVAGDKTTGNNMGEGGGNGYDYLHWRLGLSYEIKGCSLNLSYQDTNDKHFLGSAADSRLVFTVSRSLWYEGDNSPCALSLERKRKRTRCPPYSVMP